MVRQMFVAKNKIMQHNVKLSVAKLAVAFKY